MNLTSGDYYLQMMENQQEVYVDPYPEDKEAKDRAFCRTCSIFLAIFMASVAAINFNMVTNAQQKLSKTVCVISTSDIKNCLVSSTDFFACAGAVALFVTALLLRKAWHPNKEAIPDGLLLSTCVSFCIVEITPILAISNS